MNGTVNFHKYPRIILSVTCICIVCIVFYQMYSQATWCIVTKDLNLKRTSPDLVANV